MSSIRDAQWETDPKDADRQKTKVGKVIVTIPKDYVRPRPMFCPVCARPMRNIDDVRTFEENGCCSFCDVHFARPKRDVWKSGWRPTREEVESLIAEKHLDRVSENVLGR